MAVPTTTNYRRLPGRSLGFFQSSSLWIGPDHLLLVNVVPGGETYRRFFFADIQALIIRPTTLRTRANVVLLILAAFNLFPLFALLADDRELRALAFVALGSLVWSAFALVNTLRGPACETSVQTAVQVTRVGALGRVRTVHRVLELLRPRLLATQTPTGPSATTSQG